MSGAALLLLVVTWAHPGPSDDLQAGESPLPGIVLEVTVEDRAVAVRAALAGPPPAWVVDEVVARRPTAVTYEVRLRARRRAWWDRRVWRGELITRGAFDPITGRYRCEAVLDGAIIASDDLGTAEGALGWLVRPPEIRIALPDEQEPDALRLRVRAVFSTSTVWLVFPRSEGTDWTELPLVDGAAGPANETDG